MPGMDLLVPRKPDGVSQDAYLRDLLADACRKVDDATRSLHLNVGRHLRDDAAECSTRLRELRNAARQAVEMELDVEEPMMQVLAHLHRELEQADHLFMASDLYKALRDEDGAYDQVEECSLAIGDLSGHAFMCYAVNELRDMRGLFEVEHVAKVPLMHALMRAITAGVLEAHASPLPGDNLGWKFDNLLSKTIRQSDRIAQDDPMVDAKLAGISSCALWNLARICQRDEMSGEQADLYRAVRSTSLSAIDADIAYQRRKLRCLPDLEYFYDVGVALGTVRPILVARAEGHNIQMPRRANPYCWLQLFKSLPSERGEQV